jgi:hypothetical protein
MNNGLTLSCSESLKPKFFHQIIHDTTGMSNSMKNVKKLQVTAKALKNVRSVDLLCTTHNSVTWDVFNRLASNFLIGFCHLSKVTIRFLQLRAWKLELLPTWEEIDEMERPFRAFRVNMKLGVKGTLDRHIEWELQLSENDERHTAKVLIAKE